MFASACKLYSHTWLGARSSGHIPAFKEVVIVCERALMAISATSEPPGWSCVRAVPEMALLHHVAYDYVQSLSLQSFREELRWCTEWSLARAAKNRLREAVRYWREAIF